MPKGQIVSDGAAKGSAGRDRRFRRKRSPRSSRHEKRNLGDGRSRRDAPLPASPPETDEVGERIAANRRALARLRAKLRRHGIPLAEIALLLDKGRKGDPRGRSCRTTGTVTRKDRLVALPEHRRFVSEVIPLLPDHGVLFFVSFGTPPAVKRETLRAPVPLHDAALRARNPPRRAQRRGGSSAGWLAVCVCGVTRPSACPQSGSFARPVRGAVLAREQEDPGG